MRTGTQNLRTLALSEIRRLERWSVQVEQRSSTDVHADMFVSHTVIGLHNWWSSFCRTYFLSVSTGTKIGRRTTTTVPALKTHADALLAAVAYVNRGKPWFKCPATVSRREEPTWYDAPTLAGLVGALQCTEQNTAQGALGFIARTAVDLTIIRNFYAHRNDDTARKVQPIARRYLLPASTHPTHLLLARAPRRPQRILSDWLDDIRFVVDYVSS